MTDKEAIELLKKDKERRGNCFLISVALDMAIKALSTEPCEDCGAQVHGRVVSEEEGEKASIEVWNKRVEVKEAVNMSLPKMGYSKSDIKSATSTLAMLKSANVLHGDFYGAITVALAVMEEAIKENGDD